MLVNFIPPKTHVSGLLQDLMTKTATHPAVGGDLGPQCQNLALRRHRKVAAQTPSALLEGSCCDVAVIQTLAGPNVCSRIIDLVTAELHSSCPFAVDDQQLAACVPQKPCRVRNCGPLSDSAYTA